MSELKLCPFCGEMPEIDDWMGITSLPLRYYINCISECCFAYRADSNRLFDTEQEAIKAWNTRHVLTDDERILEHLERKKK